MSDTVKAALIIGIAIVLSQGFYDVSATGKAVAFKVNKFTGSTTFCAADECTSVNEEWNDMVTSNSNRIEKNLKISRLKNFRAKYPQYNSASDKELIQALRNKFSGVKDWTDEMFFSSDEKGELVELIETDGNKPWNKYKETNGVRLD